MKIDVTHNFGEVASFIDRASKQGQYATAIALNKTAEWAETDVRKAMRTGFDRPTPYFLRALRVIRANVNKVPVQAVLWFKDKSLEDSAESMVVPHIDGGGRKVKPFEKRLQRMGVLPAGWFAVPGGGASLDAYGNMSRGQLSQLLNVLGAYTEAGYNKANKATVARLAKGNAKKNVYGFAYWINPVGAKTGRHIPPGVYQRIATPFGSSLKPILIFVKQATYRKRLDFYGIVQRAVDARFAGEFDKAYENAMRTAR